MTAQFDDLLYVEVLPYAIADFLENNPKTALIDITGQLQKECRTLFDADLLGRLGEEVTYDLEKEKASKIKELLFEKLNLERNIKSFEDVLVAKQSEGLNTVFVAQVIKKLANQKKYIEKRLLEINDSSSLPTDRNFQSSVSIRIKKPLETIPKRKLTVDEIRLIALQEIFNFYSQQHVTHSKDSTFEKIQMDLTHIDLGDFIRFAKDFKLKVSQDSLSEIFKRTVDYKQKMNIDEFKVN